MAETASVEYEGTRMSEDSGRRPGRRVLQVVLLLGGTVAIAALVARLWRWLQTKLAVEERPGPSPIIHRDLRGLTDAEAEARHIEGQDNVVDFRPVRTRRDILRDNTLNIFNVSLVGVAVVQLLLGLYLDALISFGMGLVIIGLNVGRELLAIKGLQEVEQATKPQATVIRGGQIKAINPAEIVRGDLLVVGPGDQFPADGELFTEDTILVDQAMVAKGNGRVALQAGDLVYAGTFCVSGRAGYEAQKVGAETLLARVVADAPTAEAQLTPLERTVDRVLRWLLGFVAILLVGVVVRVLSLDATMGVSSEAIVGATSIIFRLAPAGMYFSIFLSYTMGVAMLAKRGVVIYQARSVEALAHTTTISATPANMKTTASVEMQVIQVAGTNGQLSESRLRQIVGAYARSSSVSSAVLRAAALAFPGEPRPVEAEAPFLAAYGWSAVAFSEDDLRGIYVLGEPDVLKDHLVAAKGDRPDRPQELKKGLASLRNRLVSVFRRSDRASQKDDAVQVAAQSGTTSTESAGADLEQVGATVVEANEPRRGRYRRRIGRVRRSLRLGSSDDEPGTDDEQPAEEAAREELVYLFAHYPIVVPLHDDAGRAVLPDGLIPLCRLHYTEQAPAELYDWVGTLVASGVDLKLFSPGRPDDAIALLEHAGLAEDGDPPQVVSGTDLETLEPEALSRAARENAVFGSVGPGMTSRVVQALRDQGESVMALGDGPADVPTMRQADLSIAWRSSSQAALGTADIILPQDSLQVLLSLLDRGQRIGNGVLDVLRLYLTMILCQAAIVTTFIVGGLGFPYLSKQGALIGLAALALPSIGLSLWAAPGVLPRTRLGQQLAWSVGPSAVLMSIAAMSIFWITLDRTGDQAYAQLTLTHTLLFCGWALVILLRPPVRAGARTGARLGDWRPTALLLVIMVLYVLLVPTRLFAWAFEMAYLRGIEDYLIVGVAVLAWALATRLVWWVVGLSGVSRQPERVPHFVAEQESAE